MAPRKPVMIDGVAVARGDCGRAANEMLIFSLVDGFVWVCWPGSPASVRLGPYEAVAEMMSDFLAQSAVGERLMNGNSPDA